MDNMRLQDTPKTVVLRLVVGARRHNVRTLTITILMLLLHRNTMAQNIGDIHPEVVQVMATEQSHDQFSDETQRNEFTTAFLRGFKSGILSPTGNISSGSGRHDDPTSVGFSLGRQAAISNAPRIGVTLLDYGYLPTNVSGYVYFGFEQSEFRPQGSTQTWWICHAPELAKQYSQLAREQKPSRQNRDDIIASFEGFLSPERRWGYGHFGRYPREISPTRIIEIRMKEPQHAPPGDAR
jgi:hypothetical protein